MSEKIAVFGGTGRTGRHVVTYALEKGYKVQMLARSPENIQIKHDNLTVVKGDFANGLALKKVVHGATYIISCVGGPANPMQYPKDYLLNFIKLLYPIMEAETSIKVFLSQSGGFAAAPGKPLTFMTSMIRNTVGAMMGIGPLIRDCEQVTFYMADNKKHFDFIVTRPGMLEEKDKDLQVVATHDKAPMSAMTFQALGVFTVDALTDSSLYGTYPYVTPKK